MTTYFDFAPTSAVPWSTQIVLDGQTYNLVVTWNTYRQGWYVNISDLYGNRVVSRALTSGSPPDYDINLVWGYFTTSTLVFREATQQFEVTP